MELTSRLHGTLLDRHRPLWEAHFVEGLDDGRYALYVKLHHALIDGVSAQRLMQRTMTPDPNDDELRVSWAMKPRKRKSSGGSSPLQTLTGTAGSLAALAPSTLKLVRSGLMEQQLTLPFQAPKTMFNVRIGGARRAAAQSWSLERFKRVKAAAGGVTVNDVVLAMCAGALRAYLLEQNALPDTPLVAMVPVSLRTENDDDARRQHGRHDPVQPRHRTWTTPSERLDAINTLDGRQQEGLRRTAADPDSSRCRRS